MAPIPLLLLSLPLLATSFRVTRSGLGDLTGGEPDKCCCKEGPCSDDAKGAVFSPDYNLCCKPRKKCQWRIAVKGYSQEKSLDFCRSVQKAEYVQLPLPPVLLPPESAKKAKEGSTAETVENFCDLEAKERLQEGEVAEADEKAASAARLRRNEVVGELVRELAENSLETMAKDAFSLYACVRWAMDPEFAKLARDEAQTEQLDQGTSAHELFSAGHFIPMRCTRNVKVHSGNGYGDFEKALGGVADWLEAESFGAVKQRLAKAAKASTDELKEAEEAFDVVAVAKAAEGCEASEPAELKKMNFRQLLEDCGTAKWWLGKLQQWRSAFPFSSFMAPDRLAALQKPSNEEQVLVCFGRRVASQLHRRAGGGHLITDQSAVGCHGFWSFQQSAAMIRRTVKLWRPPTCQLAAMELEMKLKLLDSIADINANLFDALPAMILDEKLSEPESAVLSPLRPKGAAGTLGKAAGDIAGGIAGAAGWLFGADDAYRRLGLLLGNTVVKWAVCPIKPLAGWEEEEELDGRLGREDDVARYFAQQAYSKWTGEVQKVPGEVCERVEGSPAANNVPRCLECSLGMMEQDLPEEYRGEAFVCPVRPLMPPKPQLKIFEEKRRECFMRGTEAQTNAEGWLYRGHSPHVKQHNLTARQPFSAYESVKVVSWRRLPDSRFGIWRDWVTFARRCTEDEEAITPRWCTPPAISDPPSAFAAVAAAAKGAVATAGTAAALINKGVEISMGKEQAPWNKAIGERMTNWVYGALKRAEGTAKSLYEKLLGRAGKRQQRLRERLFGEAEAGELLHSASFQRELPASKADSKGKRRFERYAITCPCAGFRPDVEFKLKYVWGEHALRLLASAGKALGEQAAFAVELRGASVLHMRDRENAWRSSFALLRAETSPWERTQDPFLEQLAGVNGVALAGLRVTYACGSRKAMHDLPVSATVNDIKGEQALLACIKEGAVENAKRREAEPTRIFFPDEVVVRATFAPLNECYHEHFAEKKTEVFGEEDNGVYKAFKGLEERACEKPGEALKAELPEALKRQLGEASYRGLHVARDLPRETLLEVLLEPKDALEELEAALGKLGD